MDLADEFRRHWLAHSVPPPIRSQATLGPCRPPTPVSVLRMGGEHWGGASRESPYFSRCSSSLNFYWQSCFLAAFDGQHVSKQTGEYVPALDTKIARDGLPSVLRCVRSRPPDSLRHGISGIYSLLRLLVGENVVDATAANAATAINRVRSSMTVWTRRAGECCGEIGSRRDQSNNGGQPPFPFWI